jgi:hypothetical protein
MDDSSRQRALTGQLRYFWQATFIATALTLGGIGLHSQTSSNKPSSPMKQFALIFRQSPKHLSETEQTNRATEVRAWAQRQNKEGRNLDTHILGEENYHVGPDHTGGPVQANVDGPLTVIIFLEAADFAAAVKIAESHPVLNYGVSVEVRPWTAPPAPPALPQTRI